MSAAATDRETSAATLEDELVRIRALLDDDADPQLCDRPTRRAPRLAWLIELFGLSPFEADVLLLVAAAELDGQVAERVAGLTGGLDGTPADPRPTAGLALSLLPDGHWDALSPERPLRRWRLVTDAPGPTLTTRRLGIDEQVLHMLTGTAPGLGELDGVVMPLSDRLAQVPLAPTHELLADEVASAVARSTPCLAHLVTDAVEVALDVAVGVAERLARAATLVRTDGLPTGGPRLVELAILIDRHLLLHGGLPVLTGPPSPVVDHLVAPVVVSTTDQELALRRTRLRWSIPHLESAERRRLWSQALVLADTDDPELAAAVDAVAAHHRFDARTVATIGAELTARPGDGPTPAELHRACRDRGRTAMDGLAHRIDARAGWDDLVLPDGALGVLGDLTRHVRQRAVVHDRWGFAATSARGLGITALFSGPSGTGKTLAAEVIARDLDLDLYRIDLSAVVNKYIGETEKNLRRLFDAAERSGVVLLFDEADALFGKRGEVRDGHDRYANLEVSYLLQRMETYRGLAILTTNLRSNVDRAFLRRLRFVVEFPFPDEALRTRLWEGAFPPGTPTEGIDPAALARLRVTGGSIRAIALAAAVAASAEGTAVAPHHVLHAARVEYAKADRALSHAETLALTPASDPVGGGP